MEIAALSNFPFVNVEKEKWVSLGNAFLFPFLTLFTQPNGPYSSQVSSPSMAFLP